MCSGPVAMFQGSSTMTLASAPLPRMTFQKDIPEGSLIPDGFEEPFGLSAPKPEIYETEEERRSNNILTVHNVLASASLSGTERLDLDKCCTVLGNSYYCPSEFPALRIDVRGKSGAIYTISLFESGRIQSTGGCRPMEARKAMMKIARRLNQRLNYKVVFQNFEIQNVLAVFDSLLPLSLTEFVSTYDGLVDYEPERFPAARVRIPIPPVVTNGGSEPAVSCNEKTDVQSSAATEASSSSPTNSKGGEPSKKKRGIAESGLVPSDAISQKLRKMMMGELESANEETQLSSGGGVGSYIISAGAKRIPTGRGKEEKQLKDECVTANVFSTGKITFTGAKSIRSLHFALQKLKPAMGCRGRETTLFDGLPAPVSPGVVSAMEKANMLHLNAFGFSQPAFDIEQEKAYAGFKDQKGFLASRTGVPSALDAQIARLQREQQRRVQRGSEQQKLVQLRPQYNTVYQHGGQKIQEGGSLSAVGHEALRAANLWLGDAQKEQKQPFLPSSSFYARHGMALANPSSAGYYSGGAHGPIGAPPTQLPPQVALSGSCRPPSSSLAPVHTTVNPTSLYSSPLDLTPSFIPASSPPLRTVAPAHALGVSSTCPPRPFLLPKGPGPAGARDSLPPLAHYISSAVLPGATSKYSSYQPATSERYSMASVTAGQSCFFGYGQPAPPISSTTSANYYYHHHQQHQSYYPAVVTSTPHISHGSMASNGIHASATVARPPGVRPSL